MGSDRLSAEESKASDDTLLRGVADALGRSFDTLSEDPAKALAMPQAGDRIGGRFEVVRWLGRGGFGSVYLARDLELGRDVAIKLMARGHHGSLTDEDRRRFDIEARATARLNHPNVITVHDWGEHQGSPYLVLEYLRGEPLSNRIGGEPLPAQEAVDIVAEIARGLRHAHEAGVLHLDLKPHNVFVLEDGRIKVLDLGLAQLGAAPDEPRRVAGTPGYMAPEQLRGAPVDARADVWSLGVILRELLTGEPASPRATTSSVPIAAELEAVIARATAPEPSDRFAGAGELLDALLAAGRSLSAGGSPYRYLEAFTEDDAEWFFGRAEETTRLAQMVAARPLVALVGPSGAGKSSLVRAGLAHRLRSEGPVAVLAVRPSRDPLRALEDCLGTEPGWLASRPERTGELLRERARRAGERVVLFVDQFEELYALCADAAARQSFAAAILSAATDPVRVVIALREDFLSRVSESPALRDVVAANLLILGPPGVEAMTQALRDPARRLGFELEEGLAAAIVDALKDEPAPLPLLQLAASRLWERRDRSRRVLGLDALQRIHGVAGVLAAHADDIIAQLAGEAETRIASAALLRLVSVEGTRRPVLREELVAAFPDRAAAERVVEHLLRGRLLISSQRDGQGWLELAHDSLAQRWDRLRAWQVEDAGRRRFHESVSQAALLWSERGRARSLLWSGETLDDAVRWRRGFTGAVGARERDFLDAAVAAAARRRRFLRALVVVAVVLGAAGSGASVIWMRAYRRAAHAARVAAIVKAAAGARDPRLGALLLLEAARDGEPPGGLEVARRLASEPIPLRVLEGHEGPVTSVAVSPDGARVLTASRDGTARVWPIGGGDAEVLRGHRGPVTVAVFSPDGTRALTASADATARVWPLGGGEPTVLAGHTRGINAASFSADGTRILTSSRDGTFRVWPAGGGEPLVVKASGLVAIWSPDGTRVAACAGENTVGVWPSGGGEPLLLRGHQIDVVALAFSRDGRRLASTSPDGMVILWDLASSSSRVLRGHTDWTSIGGFSPDGTRLLTVSQDRTARIWPVEGGEAIVLRGHAGLVLGGRFSPDGRTALTWSDDGTARLWPLAGGSPIVLRGHAGAVRDAVFSPDGTRVVTASTDGTARVWSAAGAPEPVILRHGGRVETAEWSPDGTRILTAAGDGLARVFDAAGGGEIELRGHEDALEAAVWSADGTRVVTAADDRTARVWNATGGAALAVLRGHEATLYRAGFSPDGTRVVTASGDRTGRIFAADGRGEPVVLRGHGGWVRSAEFSPDGRLVLTDSSDGTARLWHLDGSPAAVLRGHDGGLEFAAFNRRGDRVMTGGSDATARLWSVGSDRPLVALAGHAAGVMSVDESPDGALVVTASRDHSVRLWRRDGKGEPRRFLGHEGGIVMASFSPDGTRLVSAGDDGTARVWDVAGGGEALVLRGHESILRSARFHPDGTRILTASHDGTARVFRIDWAGLLAILRQESTSCLSVDERVEHLGESPAEAARARAACERH